MTKPADRAASSARAARFRINIIQLRTPSVPAWSQAGDSGEITKKSIIRNAVLTARYRKPAFVPSKITKSTVHVMIHAGRE